MKRVDAYLSGKAQAFWPTALVYCETGPDGSMKYLLERREGETLDLGAQFGEAKAALLAVRNALAARKGAP
jgi:hypothetical protein